MASFIRTTLLVCLTGSVCGQPSWLSVTVTLSNNPAHQGSQTIITCKFKRNSDVTLWSLGWSKGDESGLEGSLVISEFHRGDASVYYNSSYGQPGDYVMSKPDLDLLEGSCTLAISSVRSNDRGTYWCTVAEWGPFLSNYTTLDVIDAIPTTVSASTSAPTEGSSVSFTCSFDPTDLVQIGWSFGPQLSGAARIVDWSRNDPGNVQYSGGYTAPTYTMSITNISTGQTVLTLDPVLLHNEGRYWCRHVIFGENGMAHADIRVIALGDPMVNVYIEGGNDVQIESTVKLYCNYTKSISDSLLRLAWTHGERFESSTNMADFFLHPVESNPTYYDPISPPAYVMTIDDIDNGPGGSSTLTIASASEDDNRRYWCVLSFLKYTDSVRKSVALNVFDMLPNVTTLMSTQPPANPTTGVSSYRSTTRTTENLMTDLTGYLAVIRRESTSIEVRWDSFQVDSDNIDRYGVFYDIGFNMNGSDSSVIFRSGQDKGVTITDLVPGTFYSVRVEAYTKQGRFVAVGSIQVTTLDAEKTRTDFTFIIIGSLVAVVLIMITGLAGIRWIRRRRSLQQKEITDPVYQDLQTATQEKSHVYEKQGIPPALPDERRVKYEVPQLPAEYEVPETTPEYLELDNTAPVEYSHPENNKEFPPESGTLPEYLELYPIASAETSHPGKTTESPEQTTDYTTLNTHTMNKPNTYQALLEKSHPENNMELFVEPGAIPEYSEPYENASAEMSHPRKTTETNEQTTDYTVLNTNTMNKPNTYQALLKLTILTLLEGSIHRMNLIFDRYFK